MIMLSKAKYLTAVLLIAASSAHAFEMKESGTLDTLILESQAKYNKGDVVKPVPTEQVALTNNTDHYYIGFYSQKGTDEAEILYQDSSQLYKVGDTLPNGFRLDRITERLITISHLVSKESKMLFMRSLSSIQKETEAKLEYANSQNPQFKGRT